uniref:Uncharacterized protein n=1 Tax=Rhinolophus ferrumequinum TaxID=59479 RepID=A0A671DLH9_RHIFE
MGSDIKVVTQKVIQIIGLVNIMLTQLKLTVVISSIEIWSNKNKISTLGNPNQILFRFLEWKSKHVFRPYHTAYLLAFKKHPSFIGATLPGRICNKNNAAGVALNCTHKKCCDPRTCMYKGNKDCGSGECCTQHCTVKPAGILCRKSFDKECDFVEFCNGITPHCGPDTFVRNGHYCNSGESFCYEGRCRMFNKQCENLVGKDARGAPFACFEEINGRADKFGNCGHWYCGFSDSLCGKLVCAWPHKTLVSRANLSVMYTHVREDICVSTFLNSGDIHGVEKRDKTYVEDGTACGPEMYCVKFRCLEIKYHIDQKACSRSGNCNDRGICNNFNHCHCEKGFVPPHCKPMKREFGSIDDGHQIKTSTFKSRNSRAYNLTN